jgi:hypothetical protein
MIQAARPTGRLKTSRPSGECPKRPYGFSRKKYSKVRRHASDDERR